MGTAWLTAYRMIFVKSGLHPGQTMLVQGATGGVSTALIQLGTAAGMRVWVTGRTQEKQDVAARLGAHAIFETGARLPERVDAVFETVGEATWAHSMKARGRGVMVSDDEPFDRIRRLASARGRARPPALWLAFFALLGNILSPTALVLGAGTVAPGGRAIGFAVCSTSAEKTGSRKAKPETLLLHHCALCAVPAAGPSRPQIELRPPAGSLTAVHPPLRAAAAAAPRRHGAMQARAPPAVGCASSYKTSPGGAALL